MVNTKRIAGILGTLALFATLVGIVYADKRGVKTLIGGDASSNELKAILLESWDKREWEVYTDKDAYIPDNYNQDPNRKYNKALPATSQALRDVKLVPGYPRDVKEIDLQDDAKKKAAKVLAVKFQFLYAGNNEVTIRVPRTDEFKVERAKDFINENALTSEESKKDPAKRDPKKAQDFIAKQVLYGIELPGITKYLSVWVLGRGQDYVLEGWFEDYKGDTHILKFGSINFVGWRPMTVQIPAYIPQFVEAYPAAKTLVFKEFKLRSTPRSRGDVAYIFFDQMKALSDAFEVHFDGAAISFDIEDCMNKRKIEFIERRAIQEGFGKAQMETECKNSGAEGGGSAGGAATPAPTTPAAPAKK